MIEKLFNEVARILEEAKLRKTSLKSLIYNSPYPETDKIRLLASTVETQRHLPIVEKLIADSGTHECTGLSESLLRVVTYELLFGRGLGGRDGVIFRRAIRPYEKKLKDSLKKLKEDLGASNRRELLEKFGLKASEDPMPRWVRVNLLKATVQEVEEILIADGCACILSRKEADELVRGKDAKTISGLMDEYLNSLQKWQFMSDLHLPDVLVFSPTTPLFNYHLTSERKIILMDKASCIPARVLAPPLDSHVIDSCAAPGNKTNHLACLMQNTGKVFAFDMDEKRAATLQRMTQMSASTNVEAQCADFLGVDSQDPKYSKVTHILVDPSCSGSGIVSRKDHLTGEVASRTRLKFLRGLQLRVLNHAMTFPSVERVVYSTCSIHREENEEVIWRILQSNPEFELEMVLPSWNHRPTKARLGQAGGNQYRERNEDHPYETDVNHAHLREKMEEEIAKKCIRASFEVDKTNGFFVALFRRWGNSSKGMKSGELCELSEANLAGDEESAEVGEIQGGEQHILKKGFLDTNTTTPTAASKKRRFDGSDEDDEFLKVPEEDSKKKKKKEKSAKKRREHQQGVKSPEDLQITPIADEGSDVDGGEDRGKRKKKKKKSKEKHSVRESNESLDLKEGDNGVRENDEEGSQEKSEDVCNKRRKEKRKKTSDGGTTVDFSVSQEAEENLQGNGETRIAENGGEAPVKWKKKKRKSRGGEVKGFDEGTLERQEGVDSTATGNVDMKQSEGTETSQKKKGSRRHLQEGTIPEEVVTDRKSEKKKKKRKKLEGEIGEVVSKEEVEDNGVVQTISDEVVEVAEDGDDQRKKKKKMKKKQKQKQKQKKREELQ